MARRLVGERLRASGPGVDLFAQIAHDAGRQSGHAVDRMSDDIRDCRTCLSAALGQRMPTMLPCNPPAYGPVSARPRSRRFCPLAEVYSANCDAGVPIPQSPRRRAGP